MKSKKQVPIETSICMRFLYQEKGVRGNKLFKAFPNCSKVGIYRHAKLPFDTTQPSDKRSLNKGLPRTLTDRDEPNLVRQLRKHRERMDSFGASTLRTAADISPDVSLSTICRELRRHGYLYLQSRKKGLMTRRDLACRYRFACKIKRLLPDNWKDGISFYFDGTSFVHKTNPFDQAQVTKSMAWRKRGKGLFLNCTRKGEKASVEGKTAHYVVPIAYKKDVIPCDQYSERLTAKTFAEYVRLHFPRIFEKTAI